MSRQTDVGVTVNFALWFWHCHSTIPSLPRHSSGVAIITVVGGDVSGQNISSSVKLILLYAVQQNICMPSLPKARAQRRLARTVLTLPSSTARYIHPLPAISVAG